MPALIVSSACSRRDVQCIFENNIARQRRLPIDSVPRAQHTKVALPGFGNELEHQLVVVHDHKGFRFLRRQIANSRGEQQKCRVRDSHLKPRLVAAADWI
jgi:hypothetical protein